MPRNGTRVVSRIDGWKRWLAASLAMVGVVAVFIGVIYSMQPQLDGRAKSETRSSAEMAEISQAVDALLSGVGSLTNAGSTQGATLTVKDVAERESPTLQALSNWALRVRAIESELREGSERLTMARALRLRDGLGKQSEWSDAALRLAIEQPATGALTSWQEALRLARLGCSELKVALLAEVRRASPWRTALTDVSEALERLKNETSEQHLQHLFRLRAAVPELKASLEGVRSFRTGLDELLKTGSFQELSTLTSASELLRTSCSLDAESLETQLLLTTRAAEEVLVETESGLSISEELSRVEEVVAAFLDLDLFRMPSPAQCELSLEAPFEWAPQGLLEASKELGSIPKQTLRDLARLPKAGRGSLMDQVSGALPRAACEKVTHLVCTHLKRGRSVQSESTGVGALRRRASSLALASKSILVLGEQAEELGCTQGFGVSDAQHYARTLIAEGDHIVFENLDAIRARLERLPSSSDESRDIRERLMDQVRLQRLEVGAVAVGIIEPALLFLDRSGAELRLPEQRWKAALIDINRGRPVNTPSTPDSGLFAFERLLGLFLMRANETCELAVSQSVIQLMGSRDGVFYDLGRNLVAAIGQQCGRKDHG